MWNSYSTIIFPSVFLHMLLESVIKLGKTVTLFTCGKGGTWKVIWIYRVGMAQEWGVECKKSWDVRGKKNLST